MSEDQLVIIGQKVDELMVGQAELRANVGELSAGQTKLTSGYTDLVSGQAKLVAGQAKLVAGQAKLGATVDELSTGQAKLGAALADLGHQMRLLYEDTIERIKALAPDYDPLRQEFKAADAQLKEGIDRRLTPLEAEARSRGRKNR